MTNSFDGFLDQTEQGKWLLCDAPHLKSCCLQRHTLMELEGDFSRYGEGRAVTIQNGVVNEKNGPLPYGTLGAVFLLLSLGIALRRRSRRLPLP